MYGANRTEFLFQSSYFQHFLPTKKLTTEN